jgi:diacylglycerol kinase family enzyme
MSALLSTPDASLTSPVSGAAPTLYLVVNAAAGDVQAEALREELLRVFREAGRTCVLVEPAKADLVTAFHRTARQASAAGGILIAVGGDGTISSAAQAALAHGCPLGVIAHGTFNLFAREHGLPLEPAAAAQAILDARPQAVPVGLVNQRAFLVNASLGFYPRLLEDREAMKERLGRHRWVAILAALKTLFRWRRKLNLQVELDGVQRRLRTPTLFVGNCRSQLERLGIGAELLRAVEQGALVGVAPRPAGPWAKWRLLARGLAGRLGDSDEVESFALRTLSVSAGRRRQIDVAADGEVVRMALPLRFATSPRPLLLMKPGGEESGT